MSRVAITGSSGLIGSALRKKLEAEGHTVVRLIHGASDNPSAMWDPVRGWIRDGALEGCDAVVHLAGESIAVGRWTEQRRRELGSSRVEATRLLVGHIKGLATPPRVFVAASAVGFYGDRGDEQLTEESAKGDGFLAGLTADWERESLRAQEAGLKVALMRFGVVLAADGGALPPMLTPFKYGAGGRLGNGKQWVSWVALDDVTGALRFALTKEAGGVFNVVSPSPVRNAELARTIGHVLHRPALLPAPKFALKLMLGDAADELLFASQRVQPVRLQAEGYTFAWPQLEGALRAILGRPGGAARSGAA